ncbi:MAG: C4-type zinc ribbon domain-containing protein [Acidimicrobiia bacterium]|nr:C4-type zinc ribbon domain-containing protein [Acidimicrobiia bacterium]
MEIASLADLLDVQALDLQIDRLLDERQSLPELEAYKKAHEALAALQAERAEAASTLKTNELEFDKAEGELQILEMKLDEHETRLFSGGMSARETEHMRLEVQGLKSQKDAMESKVLGALETIDPARERVSLLDEEIEGLEEEKRELEDSIKEQWKKIDAEVARKEERKREAVAPIPEDLMDLYEKLRRLKEGVAVASFDHGVCGGCHMTLSPAEQNAVFSEDLPRCVHCRRLLVA